MGTDLTNGSSYRANAGAERDRGRLGRGRADDRLHGMTIKGDGTFATAGCNACMAIGHVQTLFQ